MLNAILMRTVVIVCCKRRQSLITPERKANTMAMTNRKRAKKDTRSSITVQLPADYADIVVGILAKEADNAHRAGQLSRAATIQDILKPFHRAIELEERLRTRRE